MTREEWHRHKTIDSIISEQQHYISAKLQCDINKSLNKTVEFDGQTFLKSLREASSNQDAR